MLDFLRKRKRSWIIVFFVGVIVFVFVLWGVGSYVKEPSGESVAKVDGEVISQREFEIHYQKLIDRYQALFKGRLTPELIKSLNLRSAVLEELIQKRLLLQEARRLGLAVTDEELTDAIARIPDFQTSGRFSKNRYLQVLRSSRLTPGQFEAEQRENLSIGKLYHLIQDTARVTEAELRDRYRLEQERMSLYFIRFSVNDTMRQANVTGEEIKSYYERNKQALEEPLRVGVEYVAYPFDHFARQIQVSEKEIEEFYKTQRETRFHQPKSVRLRHILFRVPIGADPQHKERIRLKAEGVLREARAGKDFAQLAKDYSEDSSAAQGGDIGFFTQGQMLPTLDKAAFALKKGGISNVLETSLGYHILKVDEAREVRTKTLKEAEEEITGEIKKERGKMEAGKAADADREKAIAGTPLSALAKQRGLPIKSSGFFNRYEALPDVGPVEEFYGAAFSLPLREVSPVIEAPHGYFLLRVMQKREPSIPSLESVSSSVERVLKEKKAFELATQRAKTLLGQLRKENDIRRLASQNGLKVEETGWFLRNASEIPKIGALQEIKSGGLPISSHQPIPDQIYTQKEAVYLFALKARQDADMDRFENEKRLRHEQAVQEKKQRALQKFLDSLKAEARIEVNTQYLEES